MAKYCCCSLEEWNLILVHFDSDHSNMSKKCFNLFFFLNTINPNHRYKIGDFFLLFNSYIVKFFVVMQWDASSITSFCFGTAKLVVLVSLVWAACQSSVPQVFNEVEIRTTGRPFHHLHSQILDLVLDKPCSGCECCHLGDGGADFSAIFSEGNVIPYHHTASIKRCYSICAVFSKSSPYFDPVIKVLKAESWLIAEQSDTHLAPGTSSALGGTRGSKLEPVASAEKADRH